MTRTIKIDFSEQSKAVVASVSVEGESETGEELLASAQQLFEKAQKFALDKSFNRAR